MYAQTVHNSIIIIEVCMPNVLLPVEEIILLDIEWEIEKLHSIISYWLMIVYLFSPLFPTRGAHMHARNLSMHRDPTKIIYKVNRQL